MSMVYLAWLGQEIVEISLKCQDGNSAAVQKLIKSLPVVTWLVLLISMADF
jgi:hypothetical protein